MTDLVGTQIGNYVVRSKLGAGGMGTVYVCEHPMLGRKVAMKVLHEEQARNAEMVERFFTEAKAANDIRHENIVEVYDFGWLPGPTPQPYLMMECLEGKSLDKLVPTLTIPESLHVIRQCCSALQASHDKGIVHRDLKPENVFLVKHGAEPLFVKIVDFGIAKLLAPGAGGRTALGTVLGTPSYMSPEQCEGMGRIDHRSDIYSLGVVLYELLAKRLPFVGANFAEVVVGHMTKPPPPPSSINPKVPREIEAIVLHAMEKDPDQRFQSMADFATAIVDPATHLIAYRNQRGEQPTVHADRTGDTLMLDTPAPPSGMPGPWPVLTPDTLQRMAAQVVTEAPRNRHPWAILGAAATVLAVAAIVTVVIAVRPPTPPAPTPPAPTPVAPTPVARPEPAPVKVTVVDAPVPVEIAVKTEPPGAQVFRMEQAGALAGTTPLVIRVTKGAPELELKIVLGGYQNVTRSVPTDLARELDIALVREAPASEPVTPTPTPRPRPKPARTHRDLKPIEL